MDYNELTKVATQQLETSNNFKRKRFAEIALSEDFYFGRVTPQLKNVFNVPFPFMSGFVSTIEDNIHESPRLVFEGDELDYKAAQRIQGAWDKVSTSDDPDGGMFDMKARWANRLAIFSGRAIYKEYSESTPDYQHHIEIVDHWDFHCEPNGGGILENHLFCGQNNIFKTREQLEEGAKTGIYNLENVLRIIGNESYTQDYQKENATIVEQQNNRSAAMGLDVGTNNYVGQAVYRLAEWYITYKGERWYVLFDPFTKIWVRALPLREMFKDRKYPYASWATHEDPRVFWSKAPADDARPIADIINTLINQELYNRHKKNMGQRAFDPTMFHDAEALGNWRPDGLVPVDTKGGTRQISQGIYEFQVGELRGTIELAGFIDSFFGQKSGVTAGLQGVSEQDKKVGIFYGEMKNITRRFGRWNRSKTDAYSQIGARFISGLGEHLSKPMAVKIMGTKGESWDELTRADLKLNRELNIKVSGSTEEKQEDELKSARKLEALKMVASVNPQWKDEQILRAAGFSDKDAKRAFESSAVEDKELISEAALAIKDILAGRTPKVNLGADVNFMQKIVDASIETDVEPSKLRALLDYALAHKQIVLDNEAKKAATQLASLRDGQQTLGAPAPQPQPGGMMTPRPAGTPVAPIPLT